MAKKIIIGCLLAAVAAAAVVVLLNGGKPFRYAGTIEATEVTLSARITGVIDNLGADEGDTVKKGDMLVTLKTEDIDVALEELRKEYGRARELVAAGSLNQDTFDKIKSKYDDALVRKNWGIIRAPVDGTVLTRYHEPGEMVVPGTKLLTVANLATVWAYVYLPQPLLAQVSLGMPVTVVVPETPGKKLAGKIVKINSEAEFTPRNVQTREERTRLVYGVKVQCDNPDHFLKPGMVVEVSLPEK